MERPSDELCDGDRDDDRQLEDEGDAEDDIVDDNGFVKQWDATQRELTQIKSVVRELPSDETANGDVSDNKQLEDEGDAEDDIVDDNGFVKQWDATQRELAQLRSFHREQPSDETANGDSSDNK